MKTVKSTSIICTIASTAIFCFLVLFTPVRVNAEQSYTPAAQDQPEELFSAYVDHVFYDGVEENSGDLYAASSDGMASSAGGMDDEIIGAASGSDISIGASNASRRETLSAADAYVYDVVYQAVCDIADGKRSSSEITFPVSAAEAAAGQSASDGEEPYSLSNVIIALLDDCPYELYWFDKTANTNSEREGDNFVIRMPVSSAYAVSGTTGTYEADTAITGAATAAAANAKSVAAMAYGEGLYDALDFYRGWICDNTSYNYSAPGTGYGNPWQMIWVFDGDPSTQVVCEGYAKAFKYLCDLYASANPDTELACYLTEGTISVPSASAANSAHMWNVVRMDNARNYLVDVTNCDTSSDTRRLFLLGTDDSRKETYQGTERTVQYTVTATDGTNAVYRYEYHGRYISLMMYSEDEICLYSADYDRDDRTNTFRDVRDEGSYYYGPVYRMANAGIVSGTSAYYYSPGSSVTRAQFITMLYRLAGSPEAGASGGFADVGAEKYYAPAVAWAKGEGIASGRTADLFDPGSPVTRAEAVTFLQRYAKGESSIPTVFRDVQAGAYYAGAVGWAVANNITSGTAADAFSPSRICSRAQAVTFIDRMMGN